METVSLRYVYELENENKHTVTIRDIDPSITESEVLALGNALIEKACHHNGSLFKTLVKSTKVTVTEETF